jgi:6-phosphofructokinase 1
LTKPAGKNTLKIRKGIKAATGGGKGGTTMTKRVGILTSGGDCPGLNATIRGVAKALYERFGANAEIVGVRDGYHGLITGDWHDMKQSDFSGILTQGGTILGTKRTPFKMMQVIEEDNVDKVAEMKKTYKKAKLDCLLCLGGNGTHKTANLLAQEGLNIIGLPKTIDNDIWGTDVTFGFHTAVDIATEVIDRIHTTASSHRRVMVIELMGNKAGWLTLYSGIAGGADIILIPELPYDIERVAQAIQKRNANGRTFSILAVAEGAYSVEEAQLKKKQRAAARAEAGMTTATGRIATQIEELTGFETRVCVPGHMQRGGSPSAYDRVLATEFGTYAAQLVEQGKYGVAVAMVNNVVVDHPLEEVAGKTKVVPADCPMLQVARSMGVSLG